MTIYTLESETGNITVFPTLEAAASASQTPFDVFTSREELAELIGSWPADRLLATHNSLPGVKPLKRLADSQRAASKIWERVEKLGPKVSAESEPAPVTPQTKAKAATKGKAGAGAAKGAPAPRQTKKTATSAKSTAKAKKSRQKPEASAPREGSKMAQVIAMLQRKNGANITEIMQTMNWQRHTVRGFMAGALKKAGYAVESFKPDGGDRSYRLPK
jgi:hypothetical protein